ncbi:zf-DHHC-domain-containing protein [Sporormia fimetaria CBS 119925]|uniref:Palmitoyltransferase n=1 Tax=Sporormia fimetaria CBS 119925 TaxID=1340428 RepID=A0A6A6UYC5_9PLEO|nr:zf-DHHC-domain-containing protein [Sporormia fimetaria CBS 119925]
MDQKANQVMAIILPLLEVGGIAYATYVVIYLVCVQYLMHPTPGFPVHPHPVDARKATGVALIVVYCILLLVFAVTFLRLLHVIWTNPGTVSLGEQREKDRVSTSYFDRMDAFICDYHGRPIWCSECGNWKPDRTHHSSQLGRCVKRMDHYCPYAGGIVSETSHKFFVQFLFYGFLYTGFVLIVMSVFLAERSKNSLSKPATWIVLLGLSALFFLFTFGMFCTTFYNLAINYTTIEIVQKGNVYNIAMLGKSSCPSSSSASAPTEQQQQTGILAEIQRTPSRSYIVVQTQPGENPWDRGAVQNIRDIMGDNILSWFLPLRMSPCITGRDQRGEFGWGPAVTKLMDQYGAGAAYGRPPKTRRRRSSRGVEHVHDPHGWR